MKLKHPKRSKINNDLKSTYKKTWTIGGFM